MSFDALCQRKPARSVRFPLTEREARFGNGFDDGTNVRELTKANCIPLFVPPVKFDAGSSAPFQRCHN